MLLLNHKRNLRRRFKISKLRTQLKLPMIKLLMGFRSLLRRNTIISTIITIKKLKKNLLLRRRSRGKDVLL